MSTYTFRVEIILSCTDHMFLDLDLSLNTLTAQAQPRATRLQGQVSFLQKPISNLLQLNSLHLTDPLSQQQPYPLYPPEIM